MHGADTVAILITANHSPPCEEACACGAQRSTNCACRCCWCNGVCRSWLPRN